MLAYLVLWFVALLSQLIGVGCSSIPNSSLQPTAENLHNNPPPRPEYIIDITSERRILFAEAQCVVINQRPFSKPGYNAEELLYHLIQNSQFILDNQVVLASDTEWMIANSIAGVYDENGNLVGSYGGPITLCMNTAGLKDDWHITAINITDLSGNKHSYEWAFYTPEQPRNEKSPTLAVFPSDG